MNKTHITPVLLAALAFGCALPTPAQKQVAPTAADATQKNLAAGKPTELNGIKETTLPNGLTILTKEVHAAPVVYFSVWYRVGSINEQVGQTGMSHLMEHMMFKGTKTRGPGAISSALQSNGASFNASTWFDRTEYHETLAADRLELAMQIESDRMVNSLYDEAQHQKEMTVVRSEYEAGENRPGTALSKAVRLTAYQVHPYRWETIGFRADIENFTRDEMYAYYQNFYAPNNATVVIVGDFDTPNALALVGKYFGAIPSHPIAQHFITPEPAQEGERRVTVRRAGTTPQIEIAYHIPAFGDPDRYALDVLGTALSGGRTSRFFQDLVQTGLASDASADYTGLRDPDLFDFDATAQPGHTNAELEQALLAEIEKLQTAPIAPDELKRAINQAEAGYIFGNESVSAQGSRLGENAMRGDWRFGETYVANIRKVTPADVQRVAQKYFTARNRTVGDFEPILAKDAPAASAKTPVATTHVRPAVPSGTLSRVRRQATVRTALRSTCPAAPAAKAPQPTRVVLPNGLTIIVQENHATPTVSLSGALLSAGGVFDPPGKRGLAGFTAAQLSRGTQKRGLLDIARTLEDVGASAGVGAGDEYTSLSGHALSRDFDTILDVLSDELRHPAFPAAELEKARAQSLAGVEQSRQDTGTLAGIAFANALYPVGHPYHQPTLDEQEAFLKSLTRDDLVQFHQSHYAPDKLILTIVGDVKTQDAVAAVRRYFGDWPKKGGLPAIAIPDVPLPQLRMPRPATALFVPDKAQVDVRYGYPGQIRRSSPDFYAVNVLVTLLGSGLSSRLALNVRDRLGYVYNIGASDSATLGAGPFQVGFGSNPANVDKAVAEMDRQLALAASGDITPDEVSRAVSYLTGSYAVTLATNGAVANQLLGAEVYGLGLDYIQKRNSYYQAVTPAQVNAAAKKYLHPGLGMLVIAGTYDGDYTKPRK